MLRTVEGKKTEFEDTYELRADFLSVSNTDSLTVSEREEYLGSSNGLRGFICETNRLGYIEISLKRKNWPKFWPDKLSAIVRNTSGPPSKFGILPASKKTWPEKICLKENSDPRFSPDKLTVFPKSTWPRSRIFLRLLFA
jgi:hypothetical protein